MRKYSVDSSSQEDDEVNINYFNKSRELQNSKSVENIRDKHYRQDKFDVQEPEEYQMKPKLIKANNSSKVIPNVSELSAQSISRRPLSALYTFKLKTPTNQKKKTDPVSLFQQTAKVWKKDKFLTNRANNKEGRKLQLDKRNKAIKF